MCFFFNNLKLILSLLEAHSRLGLEKLVEILPGLGLTSEWLATLFLNTEAREGWKNRRESVWLRPQCAPSIPVVKWLILLVTMVTINTVAQPFVPGQFGSFFFPFFFWAKRFFTGKIEQQPSTEAWQRPFYINSLGITSKWQCHVFWSEYVAFFYFLVFQGREVHTSLRNLHPASIPLLPQNPLCAPRLSSSPSISLSPFPSHSTTDIKGAGVIWKGPKLIK